MKANVRFIDIPKMQQERRLRLAQAELELTRKERNVYRADMAFWWLIAACWGSAALIVLGAEKGWW